MQFFQQLKQKDFRTLVCELSILKMENYSSLVMVTLDAAAEAKIDIISTTADEVTWLRDNFAYSKTAKRYRIISRIIM
jgi:hypothetical protein